jgi:signal transduction histidine kinase
VELGGEIIEKKDSKFIQIYVKDTGCGIKKEDKPKLFNLFGKIKQKNCRLNREGIGFGLNICKQICHEFGGEIDFDSIEDVGSKFFFTFEIFDKEEESSESINSDVLSTINDENTVCKLYNGNFSFNNDEDDLDNEN